MLQFVKWCSLAVIAQLDKHRDARRFASSHHRLRPPPPPRQMNIDSLRDVVCVPALRTPCDNGLGMAVCPALGLLATSGYSTNAVSCPVSSSWAASAVLPWTSLMLSLRNPSQQLVACGCCERWEGAALPHLCSSASTGVRGAWRSLAVPSPSAPPRRGLPVPCCSLRTQAVMQCT
jgi:hypothetical protein